MTIFLYDLAGFDPHGWILTLISVCVVFSALLILYGIYSLVGTICSGSLAKRHDTDDISDETAAAIALAIELETESGIHDTESGIITINSYGNS